MKLFNLKIIGGEEHTLSFVTNLLQASTEYAIIGVDLTGKILLWNTGATKMFGFKASEVLEKVDLGKLQANQDTLFKTIKETALIEGSWEKNIKCLRKNGEEFMAHFTVTVHIDTGQPIGLLFMISDITTQLKWEKYQKINIEKLEKEKFYNRNLIDSVPSALIITTTQGEICDCNTGAEILT